MDLSAYTVPEIPPWELPDDKLLLECRLDAFVGSGPGGQKRHKTNAAIRATHLPTKITAVAQDSRSQRENKIHAIRELRHKLALEIRRNITDPVTYRPPEWLAPYDGLHMNPKNPLYPAAVAEVLDVLKAMQWSLGRAAVMLGVSTGALTRFLHDDPPLWTKVNEIRSGLSLKPLTWQRR
ncbi:MAG TPA: peptide chain release factor-like protein [Tepidisphaeraceae bacterium]|nr:peptide chain release factor-like protein [Tepidisphaeraceae bacterium]